MRTKILLAGLLLAATACPKASVETRPIREPGAPALPETPPPGVDRSALDPSVDPCDDFYAFACGGWIASTEIPADRPAWTRSFSEIQERNLVLLRRILEDAARGELDAPYAKQLGDSWLACMDEGQEGSLATLREELARIDAIEDPQALAAAVARLQLGGAAAFFRFGSIPDYRDVNQVIGNADQGGLGLPDRDYYLREDPKSLELREAYRGHVAKMFELAGDDPAAADGKARTVLAIETELAKASMSRVDRRDPYKVYHRIERQGLEGLTPSFVWSVYFEALGLPELRAMNVATPDFFRGMEQVLATRSLGDLRTYLRWQLLHAAAPMLPEPFVMEDFRFRSAHLTGEEEILPRWKRCVSAVDRAMGHALARPFVALTFGEEGKRQAQDLIRRIEEAFAANLEQIDWMDEATKAQAREKLRTLLNKIGFPDTWRSYDGLEVGRESWLANAIAASAFEARRDLAKIGAPLDKSEWFMSPPTVNAYYYALFNEMVFPAGILQLPFFSTEAPWAANAGAIGMVMGHELTHGFDDKGRQFDAQGNLRQWWTPEVSKAYEERAECVVKQYAAYKVGDLHLNGRLTLGENIADIGGLKLAWIALQREQERRGEGPEIHGFTEDQQFFLSYAQSWCSKRRPAYARMLVTVDPHSPPKYRVNGAVSNLPGFAEAFRCEPGRPMAPVDRCEVW